MRQRLLALYPGNHTLDFTVAADGACTVGITLPLRLAACEPGVIRILPVPLYNRFADCLAFAEAVRAWNRSG